MDIILDDNYDLLITNGDFALGDSSNQEIDLLLRFNPGELRQNPEVGVGIIKAMRSAELQGLKGKIISELELDGFADVAVELDSNGNLSNILAIRL